MTWHVGLCSVGSEFRNLPSKDLDDACAQLFVRQRGVLGYGQAIDIGMSKHMIRNRLNAGRWERILPRTYRLVGVPGSFEQHVIAATLWSDGVGSHETAAAVWGLDAARRMRIEITVDGGPSGTPVDWITLHRTNRALELDRTLRQGIPVTKIPRTLIELGASVPRWRLQAGLDHALRDGFTTPHQLFVELARLVGQAGVVLGGSAGFLKIPISGYPRRQASWSVESWAAYGAAFQTRSANSPSSMSTVRLVSSTLRGPIA